MIQSAGRVRAGEWLIRERGRGREAAMAAYVTFRMTLAGHTGLLPHQFYCCPRGHHTTHTHSLYVSHPHQHPTTHTHMPSPWRRGSTWPNTPAASDWLLKASNTPPAPQPARLCLETERLRCYHYRPLLQHHSAQMLWSPSSCQKMSDSQRKTPPNDKIYERLNRTS